MTTLKSIPYEHERDFARVRSLLMTTYRETRVARNWMIDRWEFCRGFAQTMMQTTESWPSTVGLWVDDHDQIRAVVTSEGEARGEAHFFFSLPPGPIPLALIGAVFDHAETRLALPAPALPRVQLRIWEGYPELEAEARRRGMTRAWTETMSHKTIDPTEGASLPEGYRFAWGTQVDDGAKGWAHIRAFGYEADPRAALATASWTALRDLPGWRSDLELFVLAPNGTVVAFVNLWFDPVNHLAICEPVGTDPDHRRRGLARALIALGGRRVWALGGKELLVGSDQPFYQACGFVPRERHGVWQK